MRKHSSILILLVIGCFGSLWLWFLYTSYRGSDHLAFVAVRCGIEDPEVLGKIEVFLVSPWGSETPRRLEEDRTWRVTRVRDSGKRAVTKVRAVFSPEISQEVGEADWEISWPCRIPEFTMTAG